MLTQDDPSFPSVVKAFDDTTLEQSFRFEVEAVPTVIRLENGKEIARTFGWNRAEWERVTGLQGSRLGLAGDASRLRLEDARARRLGGAGRALWRQRPRLAPDRIGEWDDEIEACFDRGWSDGLPVVPPTDARIMRMLEGTIPQAATRSSDTCRPILRRSRSRRSRSTPCWPAASPSTCPSFSPHSKPRSNPRRRCMGCSARPASRGRSSWSMDRSRARSA